MNDCEANAVEQRLCSLQAEMAQQRSLIANLRHRIAWLEHSLQSQSAASQQFEQEADSLRSHLRQLHEQLAAIHYIAGLHGTDDALDDKKVVDEID